MKILGSTLEAISEKKMGICKQDVPIVIGPDCPIEHMIDYLTHTKGIDENLIYLAQSDTENDEISDYISENNSIARKVIEVLLDTTKDEILTQILTDEIIGQALLSQPKARLELIYESQKDQDESIRSVYFDAAHNKNGITKSIETFLSHLKDGSDIVILCSFIKSDNISNNIKSILEHRLSNKILSVFLVQNESNNDTGFTNKQISIKNTENSIVINDSNTGTEFEFETKHDYLKHIGSLEQTLDYLHTSEKYNSKDVLILGTFRLYSKVTEYYKKSDSI